MTPMAGTSIKIAKERGRNYTGSAHNGMTVGEMSLIVGEMESTFDQCVNATDWMVAHLHVSVHKTVSENLNLAEPYDDQFHQAMCETVEKLMESGFRIRFAFIHGFDIDILFAPNEQSFKREVQRFGTKLASRASAFMTMTMNYPITFECKIIPCSDDEQVITYFVFRELKASSECLTSYCLWAITRDGVPKAEAGSRLNCQKNAAKYALLRDHGIEFDELPRWQRYGTAYNCRVTVSEEYDPVLKQRKVVHKPIPHRYGATPIGDRYRKLLISLLQPDWERGTE